MSKGSMFWNLMAKTYAKSPVSDENAYQEKLQLTRDYLNTDSEVLEFGCGTGSTAIAHAPFVKTIQAIDFSSKMIDICRAKADDAGVSNVTFQQSTIDAWHVAQGSYNAVMGHSILHLLRNWQVVIPQVYGLLKPGGVFISSTTCVGGKGGVLQYILPIGGAIGILPPVQFFTAGELVQAITSAGFQIEKQWLPKGADAVFIVARKPG